MAIGIALIGGFVLGSITLNSIPALADKSSSPKFQTNTNGETYGSMKDVTVYGQEPDLILAEGVDGTTGYVRFKDLNGPEPKNPEEAKEYMDKLIKSGSRMISVYDVDGKTIKGQFKLNPPHSVNHTLVK